MVRAPATSRPDEVRLTRGDWISIVSIVVSATLVILGSSFGVTWYLGNKLGQIDSSLQQHEARLGRLEGRQ